MRADDLREERPAPTSLMTTRAETPPSAVEGRKAPSVAVVVPGTQCSGLLVLFDDKPLNSLRYGGACTGVGTIATLDDVERIEIVRGPTSALFGTGAFFATIQVVARAGASERRAELRAATYDGVVSCVGARFDAPTRDGSLYGAVTLGAQSAPPAYALEFREAPAGTEPSTECEGGRSTVG